MSSSEILAAFKGIHATLAAEEKLKRLGARPSLVPTPPRLSADCGFVVSLPGLDDREAKALWARLGMPGRLYRVTGAAGERQYEAID